MNIENIDEAAKLIAANIELNLQSGVVIAVPPNNLMDSNILKHAIDEAIAEAKSKNIKGHKVTPFLLSRVKELTKGESLEANISLIKNNAQVAAKIAKSLNVKIKSNST